MQTHSVTVAMKIFPACKCQSYIHLDQGRTNNSLGPQGNRGSWGPCVLAHTQKTPIKAYKKVPGAFHGAPY
ncbi:unnamed protein product [Staurois parvus]|uniref:Uncharacterized protein n=1 Tax=Staurois parvus TaxID=386267 RepID=A0ABN9HWU2_9NEOB|nr:unnamed protein product [Staurois parvus]